MISVNYKIYEIFYEILLNKFRKTQKGLHKNNIITELPIGETAIWDTYGFNEFGEIQLNTEILFRAKGRYFYRYHCDALNNKKDIKLQEEKFTRALDFIDVKLSDVDIKKIRKKSDWVDACDLLYSEFRRINCSQLSLDNSTILIDTINPSKKKSVTMPKEIVEFNIVQRIIEQFLFSIHTKDFLNAWNLLSPEFKYDSSLKGNYKRFKASFFNFEQLISKLEFTDWGYSYGFINCTVAFEHQISIYDLFELHNQCKTKVSLDYIRKHMSQNDLHVIYENSMFLHFVAEIFEHANLISIEQVNNLRPEILKSFEFQRVLFYLLYSSLDFNHISYPAPMINKVQFELVFSVIYYEDKSWLIADIQENEKSFLVPDFDVPSLMIRL